MTEKLYYENPYLKEWEAKIIKIINKEDKICAILDKTAFYPEGGGQSSDRGFIGEAEVLEVFEEEKQIYHVLGKIPKEKSVKCGIDFNRRYDLMQQHTGQHLLSSVFYDKYKGETSSFHIGEEYVSIDISIPDMSEDIVKHVEKTANELIYKNIDIKSYIVEKSELSNLPLRKVPKVEEDIRIVEIKNIDYSTCCGTHLRNTGELGVIKIIKTENYKGATRIYFKCGKRALNDFQSKHNMVRNLSRMLGVDLEMLENKVRSNIEDLESLYKEVKQLKESLYIYEARDIIKNNSSKIICVGFRDRAFDDVQGLGRIVLQGGEFLLIAYSELDNKLWLAHNGNFNIHCGKIFKENLQKFNGRGGGSDRQAQASFLDTKNLMAFSSFLKEKYNQ
ncbi:threonine/alanine tRNA ligase second additional domain protein [Clostridiales bacterium oral taxon 876 str. F0540]|nr:threonine/alanine tRNA ligase second additional domain protein [Clostridiales bacterium oral taxon 876 str. F0540]